MCHLELPEMKPEVVGVALFDFPKSGRKRKNPPRISRARKQNSSQRDCVSWGAEETRGAWKSEAKASRAQRIIETEAFHMGGRDGFENQA